MRASAAIAIVCALIGGTASLLLAKATGWVDGDAETVVLRERAGVAAAVEIETGSGDEAVRPLPGDEFDAARIYRERAAGIVTVISLFGDHGEDSTSGAQGSGFVVSRDGHVLTNSHVITTAGDGGGDVEPASRVYAEFPDGDRVEATIVGWDLFDDVGVLKIDPEAHTLRPVPLGDSSTVEVGEPVAAIGSPFGQTTTLTVGVVGATERSIQSLTSDYSLVDAIQTDAPINRGNSGGPLLDARGLAIGINSQIRSESGVAEGVGFAVPINSAVRSMNQLVETGRVRYAWVGIETQTVTPGLARRFQLPVERGAAVQLIVEGSPAERAGLRAGKSERDYVGITIRPDGDLIVAIDGEPVSNAEDVVRAVTRRLPGETASLTLLRGSERLVVDVELGERPSTLPERDR